MSTPLNDLIRSTTQAYLSNLDRSNPPAPATIESELLEKVERAIMAENLASGRKGSDRLHAPKTLTHSQVADVILAVYNIVMLAPDLDADSEGDSLRVYIESGPDEGIYSADAKVMRWMVKRYNYSADSRFVEETLRALRDAAPRVLANQDQDTIAVANGIFDFKTKTLRPFDPSVVFTSKKTTAYDPAATTSPVITNPDGSTWDVDSWMDGLSDDPEIVQLLWEILGAIVRPNVSWNKAAFFYSEMGNNGKGTLCTLMTNLVGRPYCPSIPLDSFSKEFYLERLLSATAIVTHENDVGFYVDKGANFKAVVTNDSISINRKHKSIVDHVFYGFMVQCVNSMPSSRDKSRSFYRRQLWVPFTKDFSQGEMTQIKDDYLKRKEVLEYVLHKVLHMDHYALSEPQACRDLLAEVQVSNDNVLEFLKEFEDQWVWDLVPYPFLYDLYVSWMDRAHKGVQPTSQYRFTREMRRHVQEKSTLWRDSGGQVRHKGTMMSQPELLIVKYGLDAWTDPNYPGKDPARRAQPALEDKYYGLVRL